jgi:hypothetical protein
MGLFVTRIQRLCPGAITLSNNLDPSRLKQIKTGASVSRMRVWRRGNDPSNTGLN